MNPNTIPRFYSGQANMLIVNACPEPAEGYYLDANL